MGKITSLLLGAIFCLFFSTPGFGQTITLKSGQKIEGKIVEQTDKYVKVGFEGMELIFFNDEIASIDQSPSGMATAVTPQMESLYKAYISSLQPAQPSKEEAKGVSGADLSAKAQIDPVVSSDQKDMAAEQIKLSPPLLPPKKMIKPAIAYLPKMKNFKTEDKQ